MEQPFGGEVGERLAQGLGVDVESPRQFALAGQLARQFTVGHRLANSLAEALELVAHRRTVKSLTGQPGSLALHFSILATFRNAAFSTQSFKNAVGNIPYIIDRIHLCGNIFHILARNDGILANFAPPAVVKSPSECYVFMASSATL